VFLTEFAVKEEPVGERVKANRVRPDFAYDLLVLVLRAYIDDTKNDGVCSARVKYMRLATFFGGLIRDSLVDSGLFALYGVSDYGRFFDDS
jgi:hypothetical protein